MGACVHEWMGACIHVCVGGVCVGGRVCMRGCVFACVGVCCMCVCVKGRNQKHLYRWFRLERGRGEKRERREEGKGKISYEGEKGERGGREEEEDLTSDTPLLSGSPTGS